MRSLCTLSLSILLLAPAATAQTLIYDVSDLQAVANDLAGDYLLMASIDLAGEVLAPIGTPTDPFTGTFDGNGFILSNFTLSGFTLPAVGLFGVTSGATLTRIRMHAPDVEGLENVGTIAGSIINTTVTGCAVTSATVFGAISVGGMFGRTASSTLSACRASSTVDGFVRFAGGLVGHAHLNSVLTNCRTRGVINGNVSVGGLSGNLHQSIAFNCDSGCEVNGALLVGGLTGWMQENLLTTPAGTSAILNCTARGNVYGSSGGLVSLTDPGGNNLFLIGSCGGLVGWADAWSTIIDSSAHGNVGGPVSSGGPLNGGFVGRIEENSLVTGCASYGDVTGGSSCGGFAAWTMDGVSIEDSVAHGDVTGLWQSGGFVGALERSSLTDCHAHGNLQVLGLPNGHGDPGRLVAAAGGLVGYTFPSSETEFGCVLLRCSASGTVQTQGQFTGGLIGLGWGVQALYCKATGSVTSNERRLGGLVGGTLSSTQSGFIPRCEFADCYAAGKVVQSGADPVSDGMVGGLIGELQTTPLSLTHLHHSYSSGLVVGTGTVGGLVGEAGPDYLYHASYWDTETSGQSNSAIGTGLTTAAMYQQSSFNGWNFPFPWTIDQGNDYPRLYWE